MNRSSRREFLGVLATGAVAGTGLTGTARAQETPVVEMGNNYFDPVGLHVEPGTTVRFEIAAGTHSATAYPDRIPDGADAFDSGTISQGGFEHAFETPRTYDYYCIPHESVGMVGRIVVGEPGGPAEDSPIPYGEVPSSASIVDESTVSDDSTGDDGRHGGGGMMGPGGGMMNDRGGGWVRSLPFVGIALGALGVVGGALVWLLSRDESHAEHDDAAIATLEERYARGEIDEETYRQRLDRLEDEP